MEVYSLDRTLTFKAFNSYFFLSKIHVFIHIFWSPEFIYDNPFIFFFNHAVFSSLLPSGQLEAQTYITFSYDLQLACINELM